MIIESFLDTAHGSCTISISLYRITMDTLHLKNATCPRCCPCNSMVGRLAVWIMWPKENSCFWNGFYS